MDMDGPMEHAGKSQLRNGRYSEQCRVYLLTTCTHDKSPIFTNGKAANIVLGALKWLDQTERINLLAAVVMPDHLHFVAQLRIGTLASLMQSLKGYTGWQINHVLKRHGPVWQSAYHDRALRREETLGTLIDYCLENPVRAGLVVDFRKYPFSYGFFDRI